MSVGFPGGGITGAGLEAGMGLMPGVVLILGNVAMVVRVAVAIWAVHKGRVPLRGGGLAGFATDFESQAVNFVALYPSSFRLNATPIV